MSDEITINRLRKLRDNRGKVENGEVKNTADNLYGVHIETDTTYNEWVEAEVVESYPIRETRYMKDGESKYLVWIHILEHPNTGENYYFADEPLLGGEPIGSETEEFSNEEQKVYEDLKEKLTKNLDEIDVDEIETENTSDTAFDIKRQKIREVIEKEIDIQYGLFRIINNKIKFTEKAVRTLGKYFNVEQLETLSLDGFTFEDFPEETMRKVLYYLERDILRYKELTPMMLDSRLEEISVNRANAPAYVVHENYANTKTLTAYEFSELNDRVSMLATRTDDEVSRNDPEVQGALDDGSRVQATLGLRGSKISKNGGNFTIRKFQNVPFTPIDLMNYDSFSPEQLSYLWLVIQYGGSVMFIGGTATGKTTALNANTMFLRPNYKILTIEDTPEIRIDEENLLQFLTRETLASEIGMNKLLKSSLRHRPDSIIVGEVRGQEAQNMAQAANTGHQVFSTFHGDDMAEAINRLTDPNDLNVPASQLKAIDVMVSLSKEGRTRRAFSIKEIVGLDNEQNIEQEEVSKYDSISDNYTVYPLSQSDFIENELLDAGIPLEGVEELFQERILILNYLQELFPSRSEITQRQTNRTESLEEKYQFERQVIRTYTLHSMKNNKNKIIEAIEDNRLIEEIDIELEYFDIDEKEQMDNLPDINENEENIQTKDL